MKSSSGYLVLTCLVLASLLICSGCINPAPSSTNSPAKSPSAPDTANPAPAATTPVQNANPSGMVCRQGLNSCNGGCSDLSVDIGNCGACGITCPTGQSCSGGRCTCQNGLAPCNGLCRDLRSDAVNCGACGIACPSGQTCNNGQCTVSCINSLTYCNGYCRDLRSDAANCGACGIACPAGQSCQNGQCGGACGAGQTLCSGYCTNLYIDPANCGTCGKTCVSGTCSNGQCTALQPSITQGLQLQQIPVSWAGTWQTTFGPLTLTQNGNAVTGSYSYGSTAGTLSGTTSGSAGKILSGTWIESATSQGKFEFTIGSNVNAFTGWYTMGSSTTHNPWTGTR